MDRMMLTIVPSVVHSGNVVVEPRSIDFPRANLSAETKIVTNASTPEYGKYGWLDASIDRIMRFTVRVLPLVLPFCPTDLPFPLRGD